MVDATNECTTTRESTDITTLHQIAVGELPDSSDTSSSLSQVPANNGGSSIVTTCTSTQTAITVNPMHNFISFSAKTCAEMIPHLTDEQLAFEIKFNAAMGRYLDYTIDEDININFNATTNTSRATNINALSKSINARIADEFSETFHECESYSYLTHDLLRSIEAAKTFLEEMKQPIVREPEVEETTDIFYDCVSSVSQLPTPVSILEFNVGEGIQVDDFLSSMDFRKIGGRKVVHFGPVEYRYSGIIHPPCTYPDCEALDMVRSRLEANLSQEIGFSKEEWCCLVTLYESGQSFIPPHSDDEDSIEPNSDIVTVSIGETRTIEYQNILGPLVEKQRFDLSHGSVHCMTQSSQKYWEHGIPPLLSSQCQPRISLTFRKLRVSQSPTIPRISQPVAQSPQNMPSHPNIPPIGPKRLLMLSDSIHLTFPTHLFDQKSVVCIKKRLPNFCLSDFHKFENEFHYTDYVFISCGVNDLSRYGWNAHKLFTYFRQLTCVYQKKYPKTVFIFNSLLSTKFGWLNSEILSLNTNVFNLSIQPNSNVWFFDSHHIALTQSRHGMQVLERGTRRDNGVHLTYRMSDEIRHVIAKCINVCCRENQHVLHSIWPLRPEYRHIANNRW